MQRCLSILPVLCCFNSISCGVGRAEQTIDSKIASLRASADVDELHQNARHLLDGMSTADLLQFKQNADTQAALLAAWEIVWRLSSKPDGANADQTPLDPVATERFLGYLEGRIGVELPKWWEGTMRSALRVNFVTDQRLLKLDDTTLVTGDHKGLAGKLYYRSSMEYLVPIDFNLSPVEKGVRVERKGESFILPTELLESNAKSNGADIILPEFMYKPRILIAICGGQVEECNLYCFDAMTQVEAWTARLWCEASWGGRSGTGITHVAELRPTNGAVYVFGKCGSSMYIEAFAIDDGRSLFRFSTTY